MTEIKQIKYVYEEAAHNLNDSGIIVPVIMEVLKPASVVDVGCGIGTFLKVFKDYGVNDIFGLDGNWVDRQKLGKILDPSHFMEIDIEKGFSIGRKFDLALCLEVAEHIHENAADSLVKNLTDLSDYIIFSASIPGQVGQNHVNEQWPEYWVEKFNKFGFVFHDVLRTIFWNNTDLARWYKQNIFLVIKKGNEVNLKAFENYIDSNIRPLVHPEYYALRVREIKELQKKEENLRIDFDAIMKGKASINIYLKLLAKYFLRKIGIYRK